MSQTEQGPCVWDKQNEERSLRLLAAQRHTYARSKRHRYAALSFAIIPCLVVIGGTLFAHIDLLVSLLVASLGWLLGQVLENDEKHLREKGAAIQEEFDVTVFGLDWQLMDRQKKPSDEGVSEAARLFRGERKALLDWYSQPGSVPYPLSVLLCQRSNLTWDTGLRQGYSQALCWLTFVGFAALVVAGAVRQLMLLDFILQVLVPASYPLWDAYSRIRALSSQVADQREALLVINDLAERGRKDSSIITREVLRAVQDRVFQLRQRYLPLPDWWHYRSRDAKQQDMETTVRQLGLPGGCS